MSICQYNSSTINEYSIEDCELISLSPIEGFDYKKISDEGVLR
jgi:hypothetical protein